jgi:autotransporter-associated beta strand protein
MNNGSNLAVSANRGITLGANGGALQAGWTGDTLTINSVITGSGALTINNDVGTIYLAGANTYTGNTTILGNLRLSNALALQNSVVNYSSGSLTFDSGVTSATLGGLSGSQNLSLLNTAGTPAAVALSVSSNTTGTTFSGIISGSGSLTKTGTGIWILSGSNTYTGGTTVAAGRLQTANTNALGTGSVTISNGGTLCPNIRNELGHDQRHRFYRNWR